MLCHPAGAQRPFPNGELQAAHQRRDQLLAAANPQHYAGFFFQFFGEFRRRCAVTGILQRIPGGHQAKQLADVGHLQNIGRQAKLHGVEVDFGKEAAALAVGLIRSAHIRVVVILDAPAVFRHIGDAVFSLDDVGPEFFNITSIRKDGGQADDGYGRFA